MTAPYVEVRDLADVDPDDPDAGPVVTTIPPTEDYL